MPNVLQMSMANKSFKASCRERIGPGVNQMTVRIAARAASATRPQRERLATCSTGITCGEGGLGDEDINP
jgi:hypothetical protein